MDRYLSLALVAGFACLPFVCIAVWMVFRFFILRKCPYGTIMVVFRRNNRSRIVKYITQGSTPVIPLIHDCSYITLSTFCFPVYLNEAPTRNNVHITMSVAFGVEFSNDDNYLKNAVNSMLGKSANEISETINKIICEQLLFTIASFSAEEIFSDIKKFQTQIRSNVDQSLIKIGMVTNKMDFADITDDAQYYLEVARKDAQRAVEQAKADQAIK